MKIQTAIAAVVTLVSSLAFGQIKYTIDGGTAASVRAPPRQDRGRIWIHESDGLHGQVVINASALQVPDTGGNPFGDVHLLWSGAVELGGSLSTPPCVDESIADDSASSDLVAAYSTRPSTPLGGGAVGVVPYRMYETDCLPAAGTETNPAIISQARLCGVWTVPLTPINVRFYGPLVPANEVGVIEMRVGNTWQVPPTNFFWHRAAPAGGNARELRISTRAVGFPSQNILVPIGKYRIRQGTGTNEPRVKCAGTFALPGQEPDAAYFEYSFCVVADCPTNGVADGVPDYSDCTLTDCGGGCTNPITDCDDGSGTGTPDGGVTIDDLLYYLLIYEQGIPAADVDDGSFTGTPDGGVTIDDLLYFLNQYSAGC
jgi:hypothetical protein